MKKGIILQIAMLIAACMVLSLAMPFQVSAADNVTCNFTWSVGQTHDASMFQPDGDWNVIKDGSDLYVIVSPDQNHATRFKGTTMDNQVQQANVIFNNFPTGLGAGNWLSGIAIGTDGRWYALVHTEYAWAIFNNNLGHFRRLGLAISTDKGASFTYQGAVITSDNNDNDLNFNTGSYYDNGPCDMKLYIDQAGGYYYLYYQHNWVNKSTSHRYQSMRVARSPISSNMAPGSWVKFYNGSWSEPGIGGRDSDVFTNCDSAIVLWSTYMNKFVAFSRNSDDVNGGAACISTCTDLNTQNWTQNQTMTGVSLEWYNMAIDTTTWSKYTIGQNFRMYERSNQAAKYFDMSFGTGTTTSSTYDYVYPPESVNDSSAAWGYVNNGDNIAYNKTVTASSNNENVPSNAVDGNLGTHWIASSGSFNQWLEVDLGSTQAIAKVVQNFNETDNSTFYYKIEGSTNNSTWTTLVDRTSSGHVGPACVENVTGSYRYVKLTVTNITNNHWVSSKEFQVVGPSIDTSKYYKIINRNSNKCLDVSGASMDNNANIIQYNYQSQDNQKWQFVDAGGGYYKIRNKNSGLLMDIKDGSTADGGLNIQYQDNEGANQQWQIVGAESGYFKIKNKNSGLILDINGGSFDDNTQCIQYHDQNGYNQMWEIVPAN